MAQDDFQRGLAEGEIRARLDDHSRHLETINGSVARTGHALDSLTKAVTELTRVAQTAERRAADWAPFIAELKDERVAAKEGKRVTSLKRWHVVAGALAVTLPQLLNLCLRLAGVS